MLKYFLIFIELSQLDEQYFHSAEFLDGVSNILVRNMNKAINGDCCGTNQTMHRLWLSVLDEPQESEIAYKNASALNGSLQYAWKLFTHLSVVKNANFYQVLERVAFQRLAALVENRCTLLDLISASTSCWFHEGLCTVEDMLYARDCIKSLLLTENPCAFIEQIVFNTTAQPTFSDSAANALVDDIINFDW